MPKRPITSFEPISLARLEPLIECIGPMNMSNTDPPDWWMGMLSARTVLYGSGRLAREGDPMRHQVDPDELALCRLLAESARLIGPPGLPSEGEFQWYPFFVAANVDDPVPGRIDEATVRERFGGTLLPIAPIAITPIAEGGKWWKARLKEIERDSENLAKIVRKVKLDVWMKRSLAGAQALFARGLDDYEDDKAQQAVGDPILRDILGIEPADRLGWTDVSTVLQLFRTLRLIRFFTGPEFKDAAFVEIGNSGRVPEKKWPRGMVSWPSCLPRLIVGLTRAGSLAGVIGYVVES